MATLKKAIKKLFCKHPSRKHPVDKKYLVDYLMQKDENVIKLAIAYADNYLKYGVNVTEQWKTAVEQKNALERAEYYGYCKCIRDRCK